MAEAGIFVLEPERPNAAPRAAWLENLFLTHVFPILTPIAVDPAHPFPFILNKGLSIVVEMQRESDGKAMSGLIPIPGQIERFIRLRSGWRQADGAPLHSARKHDRHVLSELFPGFEIKSQGAFRVLRDSEIEIQEEAEDLVRSFESQLKRRRRGNVIRLELEARMPERLRKFVVEELEVGDGSVFVKDGMLALADTSQLIVADRPDLTFKPFPIRFPERIREFSGDCFAAIRKKDIVVHHPYEKLRRRRAVSASGRRRSERDGDQVDALSHVARQSHHPGVERSG